MHNIIRTYNRIAKPYDFTWLIFITTKISSSLCHWIEVPTVQEHRQRYHTKDGVVWKKKEPYQRGGNHDED